MNLTEPQAGSDLSLVRYARRAAGRRPPGSCSVTKIFITGAQPTWAENIGHLVARARVGAPRA